MTSGLKISLILPTLDLQGHLEHKSRLQKLQKLVKVWKFTFYIIRSSFFSNIHTFFQNVDVVQFSFQQAVGAIPLFKIRLNSLEITAFRPRITGFHNRRQEPWSHQPFHSCFPGTKERNGQATFIAKVLDYSSFLFAGKTKKPRLQPAQVTVTTVLQSKDVLQLKTTVSLL